MFVKTEINHVITNRRHFIHHPRLLSFLPPSFIASCISWQKKRKQKKNHIEQCYMSVSELKEADSWKEKQTVFVKTTGFFLLKSETWQDAADITTDNYWNYFLPLCFTNVVALREGKHVREIFKVCTVVSRE